MQILNGLASCVSVGFWFYHKIVHREDQRQVLASVRISFKRDERDESSVWEFCALK